MFVCAYVGVYLSICACMQVQIPEGYDMRDLDVVIQINVKTGYLRNALLAYDQVLFVRTYVCMYVCMYVCILFTFPVNVKSTLSFFLHLPFVNQYNL